MSTENNTNDDEPVQEMHTAQADEIEDVRVEDEMEQSYIDYAMSVIIGRSIPDVRDGMKPVQRRILYAMHEMGVSNSSSHRKSSSIVGDTMGDYHPHGDSAIYDALARMAQDFSLRSPLVDGQGNFGSVDGDPPAAMRYTEARFAEIGEELMEDIDEGTVNFKSNYDDRLEEPEVLPAKFPNLLANGATGIAVGLSTKIPSHNLNELVEATKHLIDNPDCDTEALMEHMPGPDFPMGGKIVGRDGIYDAYSTGEGRLKVRASYRVEQNDNGKDRIIITELPPETKKEKLVKDIADLVDAERLEGVYDLRDESNQEEGIRVVIELNRSAITDVVENQLVDSVLTGTYSIKLLAIDDGDPEIFGLKGMLQRWLDHRREVVRRRTEDELEEREHRAHILEGRMRALENVDDIVEIIRNSESRTVARESIEEEYGFSEDQSNHIVRLQLGSLTSMEETEVQEEYEDVQERIERLNEILDNESELLAVIKEELDYVKENYGNERRTEIIDADEDVSREDLIPQKDIVVPITEEGYVKRMNTETFSTQNRGGKGIIGIDLKRGDRIKDVFHTNTHDHLLCFTTEGNVYKMKGYQLPEYSRNARGEPDVTVFSKLDDDEHIDEILGVSDDEVFNNEDMYLTLVTENGKIKRTPIGEYDNILSTGIRAIRLGDDDTVADAKITHEDEEVLVGTSDGRAIRFDLADVSSTGRSSQGVNAVELSDEDMVTGFITTEEPEEIDVLTITENGYGKRTDMTEYRKQSRYGRGVLDIKTTERNGEARTVLGVEPEDELFVMSEDGNIVRTRAGDVSEFGRNTQGVTVVGFEDGVAGAAFIDND